MKQREEGARFEGYPPDEGVWGINGAHRENIYYFRIILLYGFKLLFFLLVSGG